MQIRHFPLQQEQRLGSAGEILVMPHVLQLPCNLRGHRGSQITKFTFEAVSCPHYRLRVSVDNGLPQLKQKFRRFLQEDLAEFVQQLFISTQSIKSLGFVPQHLYLCRRIGRGGGMCPCEISQSLLQIALSSATRI